MSLGRLERVALRDIWEREDLHFTPWLAKEENLTILADAIGLEIELEAQEKNVGPFKADILCKNTVDDSWVLIENQIEKTDHTHLGQLMTYAAGLQAATIVWIASKFTDEHRAALDWLNKITNENFRFFGLEVELWRINDSIPAPKFNLISFPNDWSKAARRSIEAETSPTKELQYLYWEALQNHIEEAAPEINTQSPKPQNWYNFSIGRSGMHLSATINTRDHRLGLDLLLHDKDNAKQAYHALYEQKEDIEVELGYSLDWREMPDQRNSRIIIFKDADPTDETQWPKQHDWFLTSVKDFNRVFRQRIKSL